MNEIRISVLIDSYFNGTLEGDERASLERTLLASSQARELFCRKAEIHEALQAWGTEHWDSLAEALAAYDGRPSRIRAMTVRASHLLCTTAAAIGIAVALGSLLGAGMVLAFGGQQWTAARVAVPILNGSFEEGASNFDESCVSRQRLERLPDRFGVWAGDGVRPCGAERGVQPAEGRFMVAFERALAGPGGDENPKADSCDLFQLVDLSPYRDLISQGECVLTLSTQVFDTPDSDVPATTYGICLHVFGGSPRTIAEDWSRAQPLAMNSERLFRSQSPVKGWRDLSTRVFLPTEATFVVVQLVATSMDRTVGRRPATFDRHYYDAIRLTLDAPKRNSATVRAISARHLPSVARHKSGGSP